jgi:hypothetical protein
MYDFQLGLGLGEELLKTVRPVNNIYRLSGINKRSRRTHPLFVIDKHEVY